MRKNLSFLFVLGFILLGATYAISGTLYINTQYYGEYSALSVGSDGRIDITATTTPPASGNTITGRVTSDYFGPGKIIGIGGVTMALSGSSSGTSTTSTNGNYTFTGLADGSYTVTPSDSSYIFNPTSGPATVASNQTATVNFGAIPVQGKIYSIAGNVKDKNGLNLPGVTMQLQWGSTVLDDTPGLTGADGNYVIPALADGLTYTVTPIMTDKSFNPASQSVLVNGSNVTGKNFVEQSAPSGTLGSKTNPIKLSKPMDKVYHGYMSQSSPLGSMGTVNLLKNTKLYFEVDTLATIGASASSFGLNTKFYNSQFSVCESVYNKITQTYSTEVCGNPSTYRDIVYDGRPGELDNYRYLYAIDNSGGSTNFSIDVWVTINP